MSTTALIIDDERDIRELIAIALVRIGMETHTAANLDEARHLLEAYDFDVCLTDMRLPDGNGLDFVQHVQDTHPNLPIAVITAHGNMTAAVEAMKRGAFDFVSKPVDINQLRTIVTQAVNRSSDAANDGGGTASGGNAEERGDNEQSYSKSDDPLDHLPRPSDIDTDTGSPDNKPGRSTARANEDDRPGTASTPRLMAGSSTTRGDTASVSLASLSGQGAVHSAAEIPLIGAERLIGTSEPMKALRRTIIKVARTNAPVWITGESGTGKELIARLIHDNGPRASAPFVAVNCGAIPSELMESELFGHMKGAFTGAINNSDGLFRRAEGGTLFLDEVAELPLHMQVKLLRAIQERSVRPVGGSEEIPVDARILSASHEDLAACVEDGRFRHDLYYRLNVISINSPSLRDRSGDIHALCTTILSRLSDISTGMAPHIDSETIACLENYHFPGNVRELENLLERAVALSDGNTITVDDLVLRPKQHTKTLPKGISERRQIGSHADETLEEAEKARFIDALDASDWNRKRAAEAIGMTYRQFRYRLAQMNIRGPGSR